MSKESSLEPTGETLWGIPVYIDPSVPRDEIRFGNYASLGLDMMIEQVKRRVADIAAKMADYEAAHGMEDELYQDVLVFIAQDDSPISELARSVLKTKELKFPRYGA